MAEIRFVANACDHTAGAGRIGPRDEVGGVPTVREYVGVDRVDPVGPSDDVGGLACAHEWAGGEEIDPRHERAQGFRVLAHLGPTLAGERTGPVGLSGAREDRAVFGDSVADQEQLGGHYPCLVSTSCASVPRGDRR